MQLEIVSIYLKQKYKDVVAWSALCQVCFIHSYCISITVERKRKLTTISHSRHYLYLQLMILRLLNLIFTCAKFHKLLLLLLFTQDSHGIHSNEKVGSYHMNSENWQINLKACQTLLVRKYKILCKVLIE